MEIDKYLENIKSGEYKKYLGKYKKIIENNTRCLKAKKCKPVLIYNKNEILLDIGNKKESLKIPKYILVTERLNDLENELLECDKKIRFYHNIINKDINKNIIDDYRNKRDRFFELEKEIDGLNNYLNKVNNLEERESRIIEINNEILKINLNKRQQYDQIALLKKMKNSNHKNYKENVYIDKIKLYLDNKVLNKLKNELEELNNFTLISDELYSKKNKNYNSGGINYILEDLNIQSKIKLKKQTIDKEEEKENDKEEEKENDKEEDKKDEDKDENKDKKSNKKDKKIKLKKPNESKNKEGKKIKLKINN